MGAPQPSSWGSNEMLFLLNRVGCGATAAGELRTVPIILHSARRTNGKWLRREPTRPSLMDPQLVSFHNASQTAMASST